MFEHDPVLLYMIICAPPLMIGIILFDKFLDWYLNPKGVVEK